MIFWSENSETNSFHSYTSLESNISSQLMFFCHNDCRNNLGHNLAGDANPSGSYNFAKYFKMRRLVGASFTRFGKVIVITPSDTCNLSPKTLF